MKFHGRVRRLILFLLTPAFLVGGCTGGYISAVQLTETAQNPASKITNTIPVNTSTPTKTLFLTYTPEPPTATPTIIPATPTSTPITITLPPESSETPSSLIYYTQSGDTLPNIAGRFGVNADAIISDKTITLKGLLEPGTMLVIPNILKDTGSKLRIFPDSEIIFSPSAMGFDTKGFVSNANGYLNTYKQYLKTGWANGAEVVNHVALDNSINPRILLALVEFRSHWVYATPTTTNDVKYPMGDINPVYEGLYWQLNWAVSQMSVGYYGWRAGILTNVTLKDGTVIRLAPTLNAGTVAIQYLMSKFAINRIQWDAMLDGEDSLTAVYQRMFGSPWLKAFEPLYPTDLTQPTLELPYAPGQTWSFTGGPHSAWGPEGALAALDFAAATDEGGCSTSMDFVTASAPGSVVRTGVGVVIVDLDGDGKEQTGWNILYMHIASTDKVAVGTWVNTDDPIGHPSCEGGNATGSHVHIARKFNGEWILADGPVPFVLSGWTAHMGSAPYVGSLTKDDQIAEAQPNGSFESLVKRTVLP